jgi:hypothetical protein
MELFLILAGLILIIWFMVFLSHGLPDIDVHVYWPYPIMGSQEQMMDEVAIMRENQKDAIAARKLVRRYVNQMSREQEEGYRRMVAISQEYVRKVQEISRN